MRVREKEFLIAGGIFILAVLALFFLKYLPVADTAHRQEAPDNKALLLQLIKQERKAHLEKNAALLISGFSPSFRSVSAGLITQPPKSESLAKFNAYFSNADIFKWDDEQQPIINFSNDSTMAYVVFQKDVVIKNKSTDKIEETHFAWVSVYKRCNGQWRLDCIASTNKP